MSENKKKNAADNLSAASGYPVAQSPKLGKGIPVQGWGAVHRDLLQTAPRFFLRYGLRPQLQKNLEQPNQRAKKNLLCYST